MHNPTIKTNIALPAFCTQQYEGRTEGLKEGIEIGEERGIAKGREEGIEIGQAQGRQEGLMQTAITALKQGIPAETVASFTGLSVLEVEALKNKV